MATDASLRRNDLMGAELLGTGEDPVGHDIHATAVLENAGFILIGSGTSGIERIIAEAPECIYTGLIGDTLDVSPWNISHWGEMNTVLTPYIVEGGAAAKVTRTRIIYGEPTQTFDEWSGKFHGSFSGHPLVLDSEESTEHQPPPELEEALSDLELVIEEAQENDWDLPSLSAQSNAERILRTLYDISPRRFEAYSMPNGDISVVAKGLRSHWVLLSVEPDGGALCVVCIDGEESHQHYDDTASLPDDFMREAISRIGNRQ